MDFRDFGVVVTRTAIRKQVFVGAVWNGSVNSIASFSLMYLEFAHAGEEVGWSLALLSLFWQEIRSAGSTEANRKIDRVVDSCSIIRLLEVAASGEVYQDVLHLPWKSVGP